MAGFRSRPTWAVSQKLADEIPSGRASPAKELVTEIVVGRSPLSRSTAAYTSASRPAPMRHARRQRRPIHAMEVAESSGLDQDLDLDVSLLMTEKR